MEIQIFVMFGVLFSLWTCVGAMKIGLTSYDDKIRVTTVFGTGSTATTDSPGLIGEINTPIDTEFDSTLSYLYLTDLNGGGLIRKLSVTASTAFSQIYAVKTVFTGIIVIICQW
jgi:hypothetical protein